MYDTRRPPEYITVACPAAFLGIRFVNGRNGPVIAEIQATCPVRSIVRVGDLVAAIDGTDLSYASHGKLTGIMRDRRAASAPFTLYLVRGGGAGEGTNTGGDVFPTLAGCGLIIIVLFLWFSKGWKEWDVNHRYAKVRNCTVVNATLDTWLCCHARQGLLSCDYTCWASASCNQLFARYDGARAHSLVANPGAVAQPCCDGACCMHQTCHQVCNDDSSSAGSAGGGSWGRRLGGDDGADGDDATGYGGLAAYSYDIEADDNASLALLGGCYDSCHCDSYGIRTNSFSCDLCYAGVVETRFHTADTPEFYDVGWTRSDEELGDCYGETSRACADAFLNAHPRGAAGRCFYDPASRDARGHHVIAFVLDYTLWLWWLMALSCCCVCCCCACAPRGSRPTPPPGRE